MEGRTDLYRLHNGTLTAIRYLDEILGPIVRPYTGTVGPGFLLVHDNAQPHVARVCRQFLEDEELDQQNVKKASVVFAIFNKFGNTLVFPEGEGTFQVTVSLLHHIGKLASDPQVNILIQKEAVRKLNMILGMIPIELKKEKKILSSQETSSVMSDLASRIIKGGDYDLQVALMEALCRMTSRTQRRDLADQLFRMEFVASAFTKIQDSEFETDCRKFLNLVNGMQGDDRSVYSYPCLEVFLDKHVLLMPVDENLHEFWIDFNLGSQSISFYFCLADDEAKVFVTELESQWDTLCITENEVHSYTVQEEKDIKVLQLVLTEPVCLSSIEGSRLLIHFSSSLDILKATKKVYGETKNKKFIGKTTTSVVKTTVQIILDEGGSQVLFPESQGSSQHVGKNVPYSVRNDTHCRLLPSEERDAHHINQQIITPLRSKVSESCMYVSGSAGHKLGRSPFSCVLPECKPTSASGKAKLKPALEMVPSSEKRKALELKELLTAKLSDGVKSVSVEKESTAKQAVPDLQSPYILPGREGSQVVGKYRRNIPIEKVVEMMQAEQEFQEEPLDNSIVLDSQPAVWKETSILPSSSGFYKKRTSVSGSLFPGQRESSHQSRSEPPQRSLSAQSSSEGLSHKQLHAQLTQRLELVLREREQQEQNPQELLTAGKEAGLVKKAQSLPQTKLAPTEQSGWAKGNGAGMSNTTKTKKAAESMVKQINSHYNHTTTAAQERPSWFNSAPSSRYIFNKSWCPNSVAKISANQSKKASNQNKYCFNIRNRNLKYFEMLIGFVMYMQFARSSSLSLSSTSKKCPPMKPAGHNVKKHLFSDTDTDNMTDISWLTSANRKPKPNVADYTRQPVKPTRPPTTFTFETPNISIPSPKSAKALPKPKRKRQKKVEQEKNKTTKNLASRKPTDRPKRTSVLTRSYREMSESETVEKSTTMLRSALAPVGPTSKKSQAIVQEGKTGGIIEQAEKEKETPGITTTHPVTSGKFMEENDVSEILGSERLKRIGRRKFLSPVSTKESWASKSTSFRLSPFSIEKMRSAEKNASVPRSPLTPLQPLCISPAGAISPPLDLPSHLRAIQASSFYKSSGGQDIVKTLPHPFVTPAAQRQSAQELIPYSTGLFQNDELRPEQLSFHPLIASTGKEKCPSMLNSPDQDEDLRGFLNSTSQRVLQTSFDKESVISLVTLSQSSHTSMNNIATICTELEKTPASVQGTSGEKAESGPATSRTRHSSCDSTSLSEQDGSEYDKRIKAGPSQHAVRMKPRKLFKPTVKQQSKIKGSKKPLQDDSSTEEGEKEKRSGNGRGPRRRTVTEDMDVRSTVVSSCWKANVEGDMALVQSEVSTSQEMSYVCRQLSSELKRKFENRSRKMDLFTKQSLKTCRQHVSTVTVKVQEYRSQRLEAVKRVLMDEIKNLEQDDTSLRDMEAELTAYWKKHTLDFHAYQERGTERLNHLRSTIETNLCRNTDYEEQIFFSQMHLMKKDMKSVQDHLFRQMHEEEFQSVRKGLQTLFLSDVPMFLR
ncbi:hypothetical protein QTP70_022139 [Hemibagrus guttatus]|uniref:Synaptonemal complex protein 2 n=1 Tax=Hemibagrus guttatus TaxID=175788 RepID=A0AAE0QD11_9TELE|nr:hypothetical protein QTP70_022139 [Hemibagrus guttatus]